MKKVLLGMSGGVDSSVSAYLLKEAGYEVVGATMSLWQFDRYGGNFKGDRGCTKNIFTDARAVAKQLGIPHYVFDFKDSFHEHVVQNFMDEYMLGNTPNPCVLCNSLIKWQQLLTKMELLGCDYMSTGHYANVKFNEITGRYELLRGADRKKDQSYFLHGMDQYALSKTIFPLINITKDKVRDIARKIGIKTAEKKESMEICFIPDNDYKRFLKDNVAAIRQIKPKVMKSCDGSELKQKHEGYPFYTIGQRKGLGGGFSKPMYVTKIDAANNDVFVGEKKDLYSSEVFVKDFNWISEEITEKMNCSAKIRFNTSDKPCTVYRENGSVIRIVFDEPVTAVTPGQYAVLYDGEKVIGGGTIFLKDKNKEV